MQHAISDQITDGSALLKRGVQSHTGIRPQLPSGKGFLHGLLDATVSKTHETRGVLSVGTNQVIAQSENIHQKRSNRSNSLTAPKPPRRYPPSP